jgi:thymidylate synthase ThyX
MREVDVSYGAKILLDSKNVATGDRLTTFEVTYPRFVHAELMTHRLLSRNSASSRAIPIEKMIARVLEDPAGPVFWGKKQKGMQATEEVDPIYKHDARVEWLLARDQAVQHARELIALDVHKQIVNRLLEPWMWITVIVSATEYENFFALRCHKDAQPEIQKIAYMMRDLYQQNVPENFAPGSWHLPMVSDEDVVALDRSGACPIIINEEMLVSLRKLSAARCARVSYLTHDGERDPDADIQLFNRLVESGHWSPLEHVAQALPSSDRCGNFNGWKQLRKIYPNEHRGAKDMP